MHQIEMKNRQVCLITDLDGTLLGHHDYAYEAVLPVVEQLKMQHIPVVLNSSKTGAELLQWFTKLKLSSPFISENGGVIFLPDGTQNADGVANLTKILIGKPYAEIREILETIRQQTGLNFRGFGDMTVEQVVEATGLARADAANAKSREVSEPIQWLDTEERIVVFKELLQKHQLKLLRGGRFYHVMAEHDKAEAIDYLLSSELMSDKASRSNAKEFCREDYFVVALGDGENDREMLQKADLAVVLPAANFNTLQLQASADAYPKQVVYAEKPAPEGWAETILQWVVAKV